MINVVVVEDNDNIREGLKILINSTEGYFCLGTFPDCEPMFKDIKKLKPDVLLMDLMLPGVSGIEGIKYVKEILPDITIIVLTVYEENDLIFDAIRAGASGYIAKKAPPVKLINAIRDAYDGSTPMSSNIARKVIGIFEDRKAAVNGIDSSLTQHEKRILEKLAEGNSYKAIADEMVISIDSLKTDFKNIYRKLHLQSDCETENKNQIKKGKKL